MNAETSKLQPYWDSLLLHSFFLYNNDNEQSLSMRQILSQFENYLIEHHLLSHSSLNDNHLFDLAFKRFPLNHSSQLDCSCIHFVSGFVPELGKLLWEKQIELKTKTVEQIVKETLPLLSQLKYDIQEQDENSHHTSLNSEHRKQNRAKVGRNIIALNRKLKENALSSNLNWIKKP